MISIQNIFIIFINNFDQKVINFSFNKNESFIQ